ncbi:MAG: AbrB/MazE/SpoVT family DNA-binding domain-containing protein [Clostridium sp.]
MKATGIIRKLDQLGRIVIPREIIKAQGLKLKDDESEGSCLEIFTSDDEIILKKYQPGCQSCNSLENISEIMGVNMCPSCFEKLKGLI